MMEALKGWIISIVSTVIFVTIIEIILPDGSIKKYVKLATGLLIMVVVLSPILKLVANSSGIEQSISSYVSSMSEYKSVDTKKASEDFKEKTRETFVAGLKSSIEEEIKSKTGKDYVVENIKLKTAENEFGFDEIKSLDIKKVKGKDEIHPVSKVEIGKTSKSESQPRDKEVLKVLKDGFNIKDTEVNFK